ncbi:MAG: SDR family oxidoreductase [Planctomycetota bacterium]
MKVAVFGATGTIGKQVVSQALAAGHDVTAFVRDAERIEVAHSRLRVVEGDVLRDKSQVRGAVEGQDAVIVTLGAGARGTVRSVGTQNIIDAMRERGVRHLVCQSTLGAGESSAELNLKWWLLFRGPLRWAMADHERQETLVRDSGLDWTIVRPSAFTDGPATGRYKHGAATKHGKLSLTISRADVAQFLIRQIDDRSYASQAVSLSN